MKKKKYSVGVEFVTEEGSHIGEIALGISMQAGDSLTIEGCNMVVFDGKICALVPLGSVSDEKFADTWILGTPTDA